MRSGSSRGGHYLTGWGGGGGPKPVKLKKNLDSRHQPIDFRLQLINETSVHVYATCAR